MIMKSIVLILSVSSTCWAAPRSKIGCSINLPKKDDRLQPILLTNNTKWSYDFYFPDGKTINLGIKDSLTFLCASKGNAVEGEKQNLTSYHCSNGETFIQRNKNIPFEEIRCTSIVKGSIQTTNERCGDNIGKVINIGYQVTRTQFLMLFQSCYDSSAGNSLYTNHTVHGEAMAAFSKQSHRPPFSEQGLPYDLDASNLYTQNKQKDRLTALLRSASLANKYYPKSQFLSRGHLTPDADFVYAPMQFSTYFYINVVPQWQSINAGNWLSVEAMVRKVAGRLKTPLQVYTGSYDILTLRDVNNNPVKLYLDSNDRIPVPKYLWKIVYNDRTKEGIALIVVNNPFVSEISNDDIICEDICDRFYWDTANFKTAKKGYVYCCSIENLRKAVPTAPHLYAKGILSA